MKKTSAGTINVGILDQFTIIRKKFVRSIRMFAQSIVDLITKIKEIKKLKSVLIKDKKVDKDKKKKKKKNDQEEDKLKDATNIGDKEQLSEENVQDEVELDADEDANSENKDNDIKK